MSTVAAAERFSGHESFACRYGWLRKAYDGVLKDPKIFSDVDRAIVTLGVGSNMVRSVQFWGSAFGVIAVEEGRYAPTPFGRALLDPKQGEDPFLEDLGSLWLLHWKLVTGANLAAWNVVFQELQEWRVARKRLLEMLRRRGRRTKGALADTTVQQHLDVLVNTYTTARTADVRTLEESLGSPLQELGLLTRVEIDATDDIIEIAAGPKPTLPARVFLNAVVDHWERAQKDAASMSLQEVSFSRFSPGTVFRLDEASILHYLGEFDDLTDGKLSYNDGGLIRNLQVARKTKIGDLRKDMKLL